MPGPAPFVETPLGGRSAKPGTPETVHVFGTVSTGAAGVYNAFTRHQKSFSNPCADLHGAPRLWLVESFAIEVQRFQALGGGPLAPLTRDQITSTAALPAAVAPLGSSRTEKSQLGIFIQGTRAAGATVYDIDAGQSLEIYGATVQAGPLMPAGFVDVDNEGAANVAAVEGLLVDAIIGATVIPIEESVGRRFAYRTVHAAPALNTRAVVPVPPGAVEATITQTGAGAASVQWETWYGDPAVAAQAVQAGEIPFIAGARQSEPMALTPAITHLRSDLDVLNARFFTIVFRIQP